MDDLKLYAESEAETNTLVRTVYVFSNDIGMECFMWKNTSKKKKTVQSSVFLTRKKTLLEGYRQLRQLIREAILKVEFKKQKGKELKEKCSEKQMNGQFIRETTGKVDK